MNTCCFINKEAAAVAGDGNLVAPTGQKGPIEDQKGKRKWEQQQEMETCMLKKQ